MVPVITIIGLQFGGVIAFSIVTESVFQWPGMGLMFIQAVNFADIPVMSAYLVLIALFFVIINLIVDLLYYAVIPGSASNPLRAGISKSGIGRMTTQDQAQDLPSHATPDEELAISPPGVLSRALDTDIWHSFKSSPVTVVAAVITLIFFIGAAFAPLISPYNPFDPASLELMDGFTSPMGDSFSGSVVLARDRRSGAGHLLSDPVRVAHLAHGRLRVGDLRHGAGRQPRPAGRLVWAAGSTG